MIYFTDEEIAEADPEVQKRLELREGEVASIEERLTQYRDVLAAAEVEFMQHLVRINADDTDDKVFLSFCNAIESQV